MNNSEYWAERFAQIEDAQHRKAMLIAANIYDAYERAKRELNKKITLWYARFAENNDITLAEAKRWLASKDLEEFRWDVWDYIQRGEENAIDQRWMKELENASARVHVSRYEALKIQMRQSLEELAAKYEGTMREGMSDVYQSSFYHTAFEIQKGFKVGFDIAGVDQHLMEKVLSKPWAADGLNFSDRIWKNKQLLVDTLDKELTQGLILGKDPQKVINAVSDKMDVSKSQAGRLVMTESAYFGSEARKDCFKELDVEQYIIVATLDNRTSETCREMDGKVFNMSEYQIGVTAPPFHVNCRTTTAPYFEDMQGIGERAARDEVTGKTYTVPRDMKYGEWKKQFVDNDNRMNLRGEKESDNAIAEYTASRKEYNRQVKKLTELERETDDARNAYMDAIDTPQAVEYEAIFSKKHDKVEGLRQTVKDLKATLLGKEAKAVRQTEKNLAAQTGIPIDMIEMSGLQYDTARMILDSYSTVLSKYPELKGHLTSFKYDRVNGDAYADCKAIAGKINAHGLFAQYDELVETYANDVAAGFHPAGTDHNSIIVHELGHALDGYMTKKGLLGGVVDCYGITRSSIDVQKRVLEQLGWDSDYAKDLRDGLTAQGFTHSQNIDKISEQKRKLITKEVSEYAADNEKEFFAECFAEYVMSDKPRKAAQIFGKIIDDALGR